MVATMVGWAFVSFIYFKVAFEAGTDSGITILASLLMAIVFGATVFASAGVYATRLLEYNWTPGARSATWGVLIRKTLVPFLLIELLFGITSRIIIFGFSDKLSRDLRVYRWGGINDEFVIFVFIVFFPLFLHYLMCLFGTYHTANHRPPE